MSAENDLERLRRALVWWNYTAWDENDLISRDSLADLIDRSEESKVYELVDAIIWRFKMALEIESVALMHVYEEGDWGIIIPDGKVSMEEFIQERNLPLDEIGRRVLAEQVKENPPTIGCLTISNAQQWRLQYGRAIALADAGKTPGVESLRAE